MLSLRLNLGIDSLYGVVQPPFYSDITFDFNERTTGSLVLSEAKAGNDAEVVGGTWAKFDGASQINIPLMLLSGKPIMFYLGALTSTSMPILGYNATNARSFIKVSDIALTIESLTNGDVSTLLFTAHASVNCFEFVPITVLNWEVFHNGVSIGNTSLVNDLQVNRIGVSGASPFYTGTVWSINLEEQIYHLNGNAYNSINGVAATWSGTESYEEVTAYTPASTLAALGGGYYQYPDWLRCTTNGTTYQASTQAYGVWEFEAKYLSLAANSLVSFVSSDILGFAISNVNTGYCVNVNPNGAISILKSNNGSFSVVVVSSNGTISSGVSYDVKVERSVTGLFSLYLKTSSESTYTLIGSATDNTYTTSVYCVLNRLASDKIRNIKLTSSDATPITTELKLEDFTAGTGVYTIDEGEQVITPSYTKPDGVVLYEGGKLHNFIDSYVEFPTSPIFDKSNVTIYDQAVRDAVYYDSGNPYLWHVSELNYDTWNAYLAQTYQDRNFTGIKTNYGEQLSIFRIYSRLTQSTGQALINDLNYINYNYLPTGAQAVVKDGEQAYLDGSLVYKL